MTVFSTDSTQFRANVIDFCCCCQNHFMEWMSNANNVISNRQRWLVGQHAARCSCWWKTRMRNFDNSVIGFVLFPCKYIRDDDTSIWISSNMRECFSIIIQTQAPLPCYLCTRTATWWMHCHPITEYLRSKLCWQLDLCRYTHTRTAHTVMNANRTV